MLNIIPPAWHHQVLARWRGAGRKGACFGVHLMWRISKWAKIMGWWAKNAGSYGQKTAKIDLQNMVITSYSSYGKNHGKLKILFATIVICWALKQWKSDFKASKTVAKMGGWGCIASKTGWWFQGSVVFSWNMSFFAGFRSPKVEIVLTDKSADIASNYPAW